VYLTVYDVINYNDVTSATNSFVLMENVFLLTYKLWKKFKCNTLILITYWSTLVEAWN